MAPFLLLAAAIGPAVPKTPAPAKSAVASAPCPTGVTNEVTVCGRRGEDEPYRLPEQFRDPGFRTDGAHDSVSRERHKLLDVGSAGTGSCSKVGGGGWTGCMVNDWRAQEQQRGFRSPAEVQAAEGPPNR
jgi:hypothetical protein